MASSGDYNGKFFYALFVAVAIFLGISKFVTAANVNVILTPTEAHLKISSKIFMKCSVTDVGSGRTPLVRWRLSGAEYTPTTLPDRFNSNATGLTIDPITSKDNELEVQCYVLMVDPPTITVHNSNTVVIHVLQQTTDRETQPTTAQQQQQQQLHPTSGATRRNCLLQTIPVLSITLLITVSTILSF